MKIEPDSSHRCTAKRQEAAHTDCNVENCDCASEKKIVNKEGISHWRRCPELVECPSLEISKT